MKIWNNDRAMVANAIGCQGCKLVYKRIIITEMVDDGDFWIEKCDDTFYYGRIKVNNPSANPNNEVASVYLNDNHLTFRDKLNDNMLFDSVKNESGYNLGMQFTGIKITKKPL